MRMKPVLKTGRNEVKPLISPPSELGVSSGSEEEGGGDDDGDDDDDDDDDGRTDGRMDGW